MSPWRLVKDKGKIIYVGHETAFGEPRLLWEREWRSHCLVGAPSITEIAFLSGC